MAVIEVILKEGGVIEVAHNFQPVEETEYVHWHFKNPDDEVKRVTIEFADADYFQVSGAPTRSFSRTLGHSDTIYGRPPAGRSFPKLGDHLVSGIRDKYSITTFDEDDNEIGSLDPEIVPIKP